MVGTVVPPSCPPLLLPSASFVPLSMSPLPPSPLSLCPPQIISEEIAELQRAHATTVAKIAEHKRKLVELSHRVLKVPASDLHGLRIDSLHWSLVLIC